MTGWLPYDLADNFCSECGRSKGLRLFMNLTGCSECDGIITRHRCTRRPVLESGESWECPDCGSTWTAREEQDSCPDCCGDCGHVITAMHWDYTPGDRIATAPKHVPQPYTPFRNKFGRP